MTWFSKTAALCASVILMAFTLEVWGYTMYMCKRNCKDQPDDHQCGRWWTKSEVSAEWGQPVPRYHFVRNLCERKCLGSGDYNETVDMQFCTKAGQNYETYRCHDYRGHPPTFQKCLRNESMEF